MKFTYFLIDFFSVLVPIIFSFHPSLKFQKRWPALFPAIILTGGAFIAWDMYFTHLKIWGFNAEYLTGIDIGNLPIEEVLFFFCIPYSCVFTYACLNLIIKKTLSKRSQLVISTLLVAFAVFMAIRFHSLSYTSYTFAVLAILLCVAQFVLKVNWLSRFYIAYLLLLLPFLLVNGLLTGTGLSNPVVWYNSAQIVNLRILTIPVEDIFYGMDLILLNVMIYTGLSANLYERRKSCLKAGNRSHHLTYTNTIS
ncbi:lycopene cyclase domain-containing protein [Mucilaginibacter flavidus]|uniref:lycopene cyclase domain-containing protein n=1 Tax=Mucilaginibacter flavidus TaxID=2949309 RepID=UPI002091F7A3|nr:lycopene cyclase domain-containing protein [Mucilaginibacter flavidus]MCO5951088.1 lycopene cyclase domain-containing protein [Mucilaginibacter flavidus]